MRSQFKPWLVLGVIFVLGILTGSALTFGLGSRFMHPPGGLRPPVAGQMKHLWMRDLTERLKLTPDQQAKIEPILTDASTKLQSLHRDEMERGSQIFKATHDQISALLTPEQQVELQKMESEREKIFSGHLRPWGLPRDGPGGMRHHGGPDDDGMTPPPPPVAPTNAPPAPPPPTSGR